MPFFECKIHKRVFKSSEKKPLADFLEQQKTTWGGIFAQIWTKNPTWGLLLGEFWTEIRPAVRCLAQKSDMWWAVLHKSATKTEMVAGSSRFLLFKKFFRCFSSELFWCSKLIFFQLVKCSQVWATVPDSNGCQRKKHPAHYVPRWSLLKGTRNLLWKRLKRALKKRSAQLAPHALNPKVAGSNPKLVASFFRVIVVSPSQL